jgi:hypothetical protein
MCPDNDFVKALDSAVPLDPDVRAATDKQRFRYHGAIGELIWPMITTHPKLAFPVVKLSQFSVSHAMIHYDAILAFFDTSVSPNTMELPTLASSLSSSYQTLCHQPEALFPLMLPMIII